MPYYSTYSGTTGSDGWVTNDPLTLNSVQQMWDEFQQEAELIEDKKKYPLFFWRETCKPKEKK